MADELKLPELRPEQHRAVMLKLTGMTNAQIAQIVDRDVETVARWFRDEKIRELIVTQQEERFNANKEKLNNIVEKAIDVVTELLECPDDKVRLQAVNSILDRGGHKAVQKVEKKVEIFNYEKEMADLMEDIIEIDYEEVEEEDDDVKSD